MEAAKNVVKSATGSDSQFAKGSIILELRYPVRILN